MTESSPDKFGSNQPLAIHNNFSPCLVPTLKIKENENMTTRQPQPQFDDEKNHKIEEKKQTIHLKQIVATTKNTNSNTLYLFKQYIIYGLVVGLSVLLTFGLYFLYIHDGVRNGTAEASSSVLKKAFITTDEEEYSPSNLLSTLGRGGELSQLYRPVPASIAKYVKPLEPKTRIIGRREM